MEIITLIISILAIFISVYAVYFERKSNHITLESEYFKRIFDDYLFDYIPNNASEIGFDSGGYLTKNYKKLNSTLIDMLHKSKYFKYANNNFYFKLQEQIYAIDESLVILASENIFSIEIQNEKLIVFHKEIESLFKLINKQYYGI